jgi:Zn-dependent protease
VIGSLKIGNAFGIPIRIHLTFLILLAAVFTLTQEPLLALGLIAVTFACVLLHELGHSLVARGFGLRVADITLWPLGGIARMSQIPENSRIEALIAVAGPAVNFALAGLGILLLSLLVAVDSEGNARLAAFAEAFVYVNVLQGGFNLLPAFPMDGGRLLRAFLGRKRDWLRATEAAVRVGRVVAFLLLVGSLWVMARSERGFCMLPLIALFVWFEGTRELWSVRLRHAGGPLAGTFRFGGESGAPAEERPVPPPADGSLEPGAARRPRSWLQRLSRRGGFSEEEIRWLEAHQGPLRRPPEES